MKKIKLDPYTIALIVLVLVLIYFTIGKYIDSIKSRIAELENQMKQDLENLKLSKERLDELTNTAIRVYRITVSLTFFIFISIMGLAIKAGTSYLDVLESHLTIAGFGLSMMAVVFYSTSNPDALLVGLRDKIKLWVYKRNGFDPALMEMAEENIKLKKIEIGGLKKKQEAMGLSFEYNNSFILN